MAVMRKSGVSALLESKLVMGVAAGVLISCVLSYAIFSGGDAFDDVDSPDPVRRLAAIEDLAGRTDERSVKVLRRMSNDSVPRVARAATKAIGRGYHHERNRKALRAIAAEADSGAARGAAATALGDCEDVNPKLLARMLVNDRDPMARAGAARGLVRRWDRFAKPKRPGDELSQRQKAVLAEVRKVALSELLDALEDPDSRVRLWAITGVRRITAMHFVYVAERPPSEQRKEIAQIRADIRRRTGTVRQ